MSAVTLAVAIVLAGTSLMGQGPIIQYGGKAKVDKGPRAIGLIQLPSKGKARLIPIAIMMDGKFYDADSFKASPVPMALDFGVVYEAFHTGVSQGIFTITQPGQLNHTWIAEGTWLNAGAVAQQKKKKYTPPVIEDEDSNGPPVLHRRKQGSDADNKSKDDKGKDEKSKDDKSKDDKSKDKDAGTTAAGASDSKNTDTDKNKTGGEKEQAPNQQGQGKEKDQASKDQASKDEQKSGSKEASPSGSTPPPAATSGAASGANAAKKPTESAAASDEQIEDPNRPRLRRGQPPDASTRRDVYAKFDALPNPVTALLSSGAGKSDASKGKDPTALAQVTTFPAISDEGGPDPRPYVYDVKPAEETMYRNKMLDLAAAQFNAHSGAAKAAPPASTKSSTTKTTTTKSTTTKTAKLPKPDFDNVTLHIFDLSNSNQPVLVLSATARPAASGSSENVAEPKEITLIARTNLEGDLKKLFFSQTDSRHLDETPRMELIDAVDADGDGRGELLFLRTFDNGSAYSIYRVTADRLWPLYEGTP